MSSEITLRLSAAQTRRLRAIASRLNVTPEKFATVELFASIDSHEGDAAGFLECWPHALAAYGRGVARRGAANRTLEAGLAGKSARPFSELATVATNPKATCAAPAAHGPRRVSPEPSDPVGSLVEAPPAHSAIIFQPNFRVPGVPAGESGPAVQVERRHNLGSVLYLAARRRRTAIGGGKALGRSVVIASVEVSRDAQWEAVKIYRERFDSIDEAVSCFRAVESKCVRRWDAESVLTAVRAEAKSLVAGDSLVVFSPFAEAGDLLAAVTDELEQIVGVPVATIAPHVLAWGAPAASS